MYISVMVLPDAAHLTAATIIRVAASLLCFLAMCTCVLWALVLRLEI